MSVLKQPHAPFHPVWNQTKMTTIKKTKLGKPVHKHEKSAPRWMPDAFVSTSWKEAIMECLKKPAGCIRSVIEAAGLRLRNRKLRPNQTALKVSRGILDSVTAQKFASVSAEDWEEIRVNQKRLALYRVERDLCIQKMTNTLDDLRVAISLRLPAANTSANSEKLELYQRHMVADVERMRLLNESCKLKSKF